MKIDKQKILILLGFIAAAIVLILLVSELNFPVVKDPQESCIRENLTWIEGANECEFMNQSACESLSGKFNECGSACRHNNESTYCILMCIPYCKFN